MNKKSGFWDGTECKIYFVIYWLHFRLKNGGTNSGEKPYLAKDQTFNLFCATPFPDSRFEWRPLCITLTPTWSGTSEQDNYSVTSQRCSTVSQCWTWRNRAQCKSVIRMQLSCAMHNVHEVIDYGCKLRSAREIHFEAPSITWEIH